MNLKITKNIKEANLVTHAGTFHPDDVFSTMFLSRIVKNPVVARVTDSKDASKDAIVYDIGYGEFDHHGPNAKMRTEKIKYCSFGLLWNHYGHEYLNNIETLDQEALFKAVTEKLILQIDAIDNGLFPVIQAEYKLTDLDKIIDSFNKAWNEEVDNDDNFLEAVKVASLIFDRLILKENAKIIASKEIDKLIAKNDSEILILDKYMPYQDAIFNSKEENAKKIKILVFPSNRSGYNIKPMTKSIDSKELVCNFPESFRGLHDKDLEKVSNIKGARFVHISGFIATADTLETALKLANIALENKEK